MTKYWSMEMLTAGGAPRDAASELAFLALKMVRVCRFAALNDSTSEVFEGEKAEAVAHALAVAEFIIGRAGEAAERIEFQLNKH